MGRTLCRLFGDNAGGVMMEYVVLGVLVVAAVVALVAVFGRDIGRGITTMSRAIFHPDTAGNEFTTTKNDSDTDQNAGKEQHTQFRE